MKVCNSEVMFCSAEYSLLSTRCQSMERSGVSCLLAYTVETASFTVLSNFSPTGMRNHLKQQMFYIIVSSFMFSHPSLHPLANFLALTISTDVDKWRWCCIMQYSLLRTCKLLFTHRRPDFDTVAYKVPYFMSSITLFTQYVTYYLSKIIRI